jgi:TRAP-type C4-dicarboxylate transport system substrate-binding protein
MWHKGHSDILEMPELMDLIEERSNGEIEMNWLGGEEVVAHFEQAEAITTGVVDCHIYLAFGLYTPVLPVGNIQGLDPYAAWEDREVGIFDLWDQCFQEELGLKYLGRLHSVIPFTAYTNAEIKSMADFDGLVFRAQPLYVPFLESLGATVITMPAPEIYTAMERGTVDGFMFPQTGFTGFAWEEVTKYQILPGVFQIEPASCIRLEVWNELPPHLQEVLLSSVRDMEGYFTAARLWFLQREWTYALGEGMKQISLPADEGGVFVKRAIDKTLEQVRKDDPKWAPRFEALFVREPFRGAQ